MTFIVDVEDQNIENLTLLDIYVSFKFMDQRKQKEFYILHS